MPRHRITIAAVLTVALPLAAGGTASAQGFLDDGGGVSSAPDVTISGQRDTRFLEGGGSITTTPDVVIERGVDRRGFLQDGGGVSTRPDIVVRDRRGLRRVPGPRTIIRRDKRSSFTVFDAGDGGSSGGVFVAANPSPAAPTGDFGPKIIDVETERLDRNPVLPGTIRTLETAGGPKVVRIGKGYRRDAMRVAQLDAAGAAPDRTPRRIEPGEPWSRAWLSECTRRHESFDPSFGTYVDADGRSRFCEAF